MNSYCYKVLSIIKYVDGDTIHAEIDLGFGVTLQERFRFFGINAPEINHPASHAEALKSKEWVQKEFQAALPYLYVTSTKLDSFRRWLGTFTVERPNAPIRNLNQEMLDLQLALPFTP